MLSATLMGACAALGPWDRKPMGRDSWSHYISGTILGCTHPFQKLKSREICQPPAHPAGALQWDIPPDPFPSGYVSQKLPRVAYHRKFSLHRHSLRVETRAPRPCNLLFQYGQQNALHARTELSVGIFGTIRTSHISYPFIIHTHHQQPK